MRMKRAFNVFLDNFKSAYKLLVYELIVLVVIGVTFIFGMLPVFDQLLNSASFEALKNSVQAFFNHLTNAEVDLLMPAVADILVYTNKFMIWLSLQSNTKFAAAALFLAANIMQRFLFTAGNYAHAGLINDRMSLHAKTHFSQSFIRNLKDNVIYTSVYTAISAAYDALVFFIGYLILFSFFTEMLLVRLFVFVAYVIFASSIRLTFLSGILPAMVTGKMPIGKAIGYSLRQGVKHFTDNLSDFVVLNILFAIVNVAGFICTLGAAIVVLIPASYTFLSSYIFVCYFDENNKKYFLDEQTVVRPKVEHEPTKQEFFRGED